MVPASPSVKAGPLVVTHGQEKRLDDESQRVIDAYGLDPRCCSGTAPPAVNIQSDRRRDG